MLQRSLKMYLKGLFETKYPKDVSREDISDTRVSKHTNVSQSPVAGRWGLINSVLELRSNLLSRSGVNHWNSLQGMWQALGVFAMYGDNWMSLFLEDRSFVQPETIQWVDEVTGWRSTGVSSQVRWIWWFVVSVAPLHLIYHFKFPGFLVGLCSCLTLLEGLFNSCLCSDVYLRLRVTCMRVWPVKPHKTKINNRDVFMQVFPPLWVSPGMLIHRRNLLIRNFTVLSVPSCILLTEVFVSSSSIFYNFFNVPIF